MIFALLEAWFVEGIGAIPYDITALLEVEDEIPLLPTDEPFFPIDFDDLRNEDFYRFWANEIRLSFEDEPEPENEIDVSRIDSGRVLTVEFSVPQLDENVFEYEADELHHESGQELVVENSPGWYLEDDDLFMDHFYPVPREPTESSFPLYTSIFLGVSSLAFLLFVRKK